MRRKGGEKNIVFSDPGNLPDLRLVENPCELAVDQ